MQSKSFSEKSMDIIDRFESIASKYPDKTAISYKNTKITYNALNERINQLAHYMIDNNYHISNAGQENSQAHIGIRGSNKLEIILTQLACLKIGAVYTIMDKDEPNTRMSFITQDALLDTIINCDDGMAPVELPAGCIVSQVNLSDFQASLNEKSKGNLDSQTRANLNILPNTPAYYIYTSGSTGQPKGIIQTRNGLYGQMTQYSKGIGLSSDDNLLGISKLTHDQGVSNVYSSLLNGCTFCIFDLIGNNFQDAVKFISEKKITAYVSVPTVWEQIANKATNEELSSINIVRLGGEESKIAHAKLYQEKCSHKARFITAYGSSECSFIALNTITKKTILDDLEGIIPMGKFLPHVDYKCIPVEEGITDEEAMLQITSPYMAEGYINQEEDKKAFLIDENNTKYYTTGDIVKIKDNVLYFMGREAGHEKILGNRVNLYGIERMIEHAISSKQSIQGCNCVVVSVGDGDQKELIAYLDGNNKNKVDINQLQKQLTSSLEPYSLPRKIQLIDFPLLPNKKINRIEMKKMAEKSFFSDKEEIFSKTYNLDDLINQMGEIWANKLGYPSPIEDHETSFVQMGGDSACSIATTNYLNEIINKCIIYNKANLLDPFELHYNNLPMFNQIVRRKIQQFLMSSQNNVGLNNVPFALLTPLSMLNQDWTKTLEFPNYYSVSSINVPGMRNLINYFCYKNNIDMKLCLSVNELIQNIRETIREGNIKQRGFISPRTNNPDSHRTPSILSYDESTNSWSLFISDSTGTADGKFLAKQVKQSLEISPANGLSQIKIYVDPMSRQMDFDSCNVDAIHYLAHGLSLSNFLKSVYITNKSTEDGFTLFLSPPECMQLFQHPENGNPYQKYKHQINDEFGSTEIPDKFVNATLELIINNFNEVAGVEVSRVGNQHVVQLIDSTKDPRTIKINEGDFLLQKVEDGFMIHWVEQNNSFSKFLKKEKIPYGILAGIPKVSGDCTCSASELAMMVSDVSHPTTQKPLSYESMSINTYIYKNQEKTYKIIIYGNQISQLKEQLNQYLKEIQTASNIPPGFFKESIPAKPNKLVYEIIDTINYLNSVFEFEVIEDPTNNDITLYEKILFGDGKTPPDLRLHQIMKDFIESLDGNYLVNGKLIAIKAINDIRTILSLPIKDAKNEQITDSPSYNL